MDRQVTTKNTRRPDDSPFDFNLDAYKAEVDLAPFVFKWGEKRFTMQHVETLDSWGLISASSTKEFEVIVQVFELALGDQFEQFKGLKLPQYKLKGLFEAYMKHCNVDPGELQGSTGS